MSAPVVGSALLDIQGLQSPDHGERGIGRFIAEQARALLRCGSLPRLLLMNPSLPFPGHAPGALLESPLIAWNTATSLRRAIDAGARAYHVMSPFEMRVATGELVPPPVRDAELPLVATLYDLIPLLHPDRYLPDAATARRYAERLAIVQEAQLVLAISEHTRADGIERAGLDPSRVVNIGAGVSRFFAPASDPTADRTLLLEHFPELNAGFVLSVGGADDRKHTAGLIDAYARIPWGERAPHPLVVVGSLPESMLRRWLERGRRAGLRDGEVRFTGHITDEVLRSLYRCATLFVFPSLYEGFGLPVAEAMACDCPAITSADSSLPELLEWPESTFDPLDIAGMAERIRRGITDMAYRVELRARGRSRAGKFTWDAVAQRTVEAFRRLSDAPASAPAPPLRIALVDVDTSEGGFQARSALAANCRLDVHTDEACEPAQHDAVVYVDHGPGSQRLTAAAHRYPGVVWLRAGSDARTAAARWGRGARAFIAGSAADAATLRFAAGPAAWLPPVLVGDDAESVLDAVRVTQARP